MRMRWSWVGLLSRVLTLLLAASSDVGAQAVAAEVRGRVTLSLPGMKISQLGPLVVYLDAVEGKLDYPVLFKGAARLAEVGPDSITKGRFPYYGHFYSVLGMKHVHGEMGEAVPHAEDWHLPVEAWLRKTQQKNGAWPILSWMKSSGGVG